MIKFVGKKDCYYIMNKFFHSVYLEDEKCTGCITCLKRCPTQAIRVRNGKAHIISEFCIDCGECIRHCPHHAKHTRRDFLSDLDRFEYTVALPAPSLYSQFNNVRDNDILLTALTLMGFEMFLKSVPVQRLFRNYHELILMSIRNFIR